MVPTIRITGSLMGKPIQEQIFEIRGEFCNLVLMSFSDATEVPDQSGIYMFKTDDLDGCMERAVAHGGAIYQEHKFFEQAGLRIGFVTDNEGNILQFMQQA